MINEWNPSLYKFDESPHKTIKLALDGKHFFTVEHVEVGGFATLGLKIKKLLIFRIDFGLPAIGIIHPDLSSLEFFTIDRTYHLISSFFIYFDPAIHFFHINSAKNFFCNSLMSRMNCKKLAL